jgi:hypothetical protein
MKCTSLLDRHVGVRLPQDRLSDLRGSLETCGIDPDSVEITWSDIGECFHVILRSTEDAMGFKLYCGELVVDQRTNL